MWRRLAAVLATAAVSLTLAACGDDGDADGGSGETGTIRIGAILGISGRFAFVGEPQKQALELAQERINAAGGISGRKVEFVIYDDEVDETKSVPLANRLISEDKVVAIIGPSITVPALAIQPIVERAKMPNLTLTSKAIWEGKPESYVFHTTPREEVEVKSVLDFVKDQLKVTKVGVVYDRQPYGTGNLAYIKRFASEYGLQIVAEEGIENNDTNADAQVQRVRAAGAEAVVVWVGDPAASSVAKAVHQSGWTVPMIASSAIAGPRFAELAGPAAEGAYSDSTYNTAEPPPVQKDFLDAFKAKYNSAPTQFAAFAYDSAYALKGAIEAAGGKTDGESIRKGLIDMPALDGVVATYDFAADNHNGIPNGPLFYIVQIKNGAFQVVFDTRK
ncbi:ABC transporter substrate-binding protein [Asanoa sp. NPDC050611]|uniref:ABC transporter substrate-binding protein n=1 Tax=Asanoa sp. NPDC050611 TaxID=3157098 RepID=UPI00340F4CAC